MAHGSTPFSRFNVPNDVPFLNQNGNNNAHAIPSRPAAKKYGSVSPAQRTKIGENPKDRIPRPKNRGTQMGGVVVCVALNWIDP